MLSPKPSTINETALAEVSTALDFGLIARNPNMLTKTGNHDVSQRIGLDPSSILLEPKS